LLLPTPVEVAHCDFGVGCLFLWACVNMADKLSLCMFRDDTELSPSAFMDLFTHKLVLVTSPLFGVCGFWLFVSGFVCLFVSCCFAGFS